MALSRRTFSKLVGATAVGSFLSTEMTLGTTAAQNESNLLRLAMNVSDIQTLDPHYASGTQDRVIVDMVFNGLIRFTPGDSSGFEPELATAMPTAEENNDGTQTWTFTLHNDIMTHPVDGVASYGLTVDDVLFSFQKASNPDTSAYASDYKDWEFAVGDDGTFQVTVPEPISETLFLPKVANYAGGYIVPQKGYEALGADSFITQPIGTGPFALESHTPQQNVTLSAFDNFYRGKPQLAGVRVLFIADTTSRELALQSGDVDVIYGLPEAQWVDRVNEEDGLVVDPFGFGSVVFLNFDVEHEILKDTKVREAISLAIDRNEHFALVGEPAGKLVYSIVPYDLMPGGLNEDEANEANVNSTPDSSKAMELLAEAGYPNGFDLELITSEHEEYRVHYEVLAEELRQIGITVKLEVVQHAAMHDLIRQGRNAIVIYIAFRPTADQYLSQFFATDSGPTNFSNFTVDDLRDQARSETDADKQAQLWKQANIEIQKNFAGMGLLRTNQIYARSKRVDYGYELKTVAPFRIDETTNLN